VPPETGVSTDGKSHAHALHERIARLTLDLSAAVVEYHDHLKDENLRLRSERQRLETEIERLDAVIADRKAQHSKLTAEKLRLDSEHSKLTADKLRLDSEHSKLTVEKLRLESEFARRTSETALSKKEERPDLTAERARVRAAFVEFRRCLAAAPRVQRGSPVGHLYEASTAIHARALAVRRTVRHPAFRSAFSALFDVLSKDWSHWNGMVVNRGRQTSEINYSASVYKLEALQFAIGEGIGTCDGLPPQS
jgi:hypothetical protein